MKRRLALVLLLLAAFGAGAWMLLRPPEAIVLPKGTAASLPDVPVARASSPEPAKLTASAVLAIDPRAPSARARPVRATLNNEFLTAKQLKPLYERIKASPEAQTGEGQYLLYEILRRCATVTEGNVRRPFTRTMPNRDEFLASLSPNDPQREKRIAAFDDMDTKRCAGFEGVTTTESALKQMLADAVSAGDPKARVLALEQELWAQRRGRMDNVTLSDAQVDTLKQVLATKDPGAMVGAGRILSNSWHDFQVRLGTDGQTAEPRAMYNAWQTLACEYGYPCGADNARVLTECALQGHCQASNLQDFLYYYAGSPHDSQLVMQYQGILRNAVETGDWSQVAVVRGPRPPGAPRFFAGPGHR